MSDITKTESFKRASATVRSLYFYKEKADKYCCNNEVEINNPIRKAYLEGIYEGLEEIEEVRRDAFTAGREEILAPCVVNTKVLVNTWKYLTIEDYLREINKL
jgi:hypothetical protein